MNDLGRNFAPGLTTAIGNFMAEAGGVCLESQHHAPGVHLDVRGSISNSHELRWQPVTLQARNGWANLQVATEWGAAGIAALLTKQEINYSVVQQAWRGTGFDYWLADESDVLRGQARMEVSGILYGGNAAIKPV